MYAVQSPIFLLSCICIHSVPCACVNANLFLFMHSSGLPLITSVAVNIS